MQAGSFNKTDTETKTNHFEKVHDSMHMSCTPYHVLLVINTTTTMLKSTFHFPSSGGPCRAACEFKVVTGPSGNT
eukprot:3312974-Amphidinium_carterae.1